MCIVVVVKCFCKCLGWFNSLAGAMKRQLSNYVKSQSQSNNNSPNSNTSAATTNRNGLSSAAHHESLLDRKPHHYYHRTMSTGSSSSNSQTTSPSTESSKEPGLEGFQEGSSAAGFIRRYAASGGGNIGGHNVNSVGPAGSSLPAAHTPAHILANLDRRHRSPDPPPRYNRGQSPMLLRKNILELSGPSSGTSPMLNRR